VRMSRTVAPRNTNARASLGVLQYVAVYWKTKRNIKKKVYIYLLTHRLYNDDIFVHIYAQTHTHVLSYE